MAGPPARPWGQQLWGKDSSPGPAKAQSPGRSHNGHPRGSEGTRSVLETAATVRFLKRSGLGREPTREPPAGRLHVDTTLRVPGALPVGRAAAAPSWGLLLRLGTLQRTPHRPWGGGGHTRGPGHGGPPETEPPSPRHPCPLAPTRAAPKRSLLPGRLPNAALTAARLSPLSLTADPGSADPTLGRRGHGASLCCGDR